MMGPITKDEALPLAFAGAGVGYFLLTWLRKPALEHDESHEMRAWERHMRDAKFALVAGAGAAALLWWMRPRVGAHA